MKDGGWGRIVNFGSGSVFQGTAGQSHYAAAKAGALGLTDHWRARGGVQPLRQAARYRGSSLPGASVPCPGVTLSDAGGQGERTRTRRYGRQADLLLDFIHGDRTRRSARGLHSRLVCDTADDRVFASGPAVTAPVDGDVVLRWPEWPAASLSMPPR
jgi:NAD(P)-dependent dehydrogenase (short-subunit alcohol dehydrogenase family)